MFLKLEDVSALQLRELINKRSEVLFIKHETYDKTAVLNDDAIIKKAKDILEQSNKGNQLIKGNKYMLKGKSCDGFEMREKVYEVKEIIDENEDIPTKSVVVKQVEGDKDIIFTLSKNDCANLGIEFEKGLQLYPLGMDWKPKLRNVKFDKTDLYTYPRSNDGRLIILIMSITFVKFDDSTVFVPNSDKLTWTSSINENLHMADVHENKRLASYKLLDINDKNDKITYTYFSCINIEKICSAFGIEEEGLHDINPLKIVGFSLEISSCFTQKEYHRLVEANKLEELRLAQEFENIKNKKTIFNPYDKNVALLEWHDFTMPSISVESIRRCAMECSMTLARISKLLPFMDVPPSM